MTKKLIALDIDGTLLTSDGRITDENKVAIRAAQAAGHVVAVCTGRAHDAIGLLLAEEGLGDLPVSGSNGTATVVDGQMIGCIPMNRESALEVGDWLNGQKYGYKIYTERGVYVQRDYFARLEADLAVAPVGKIPHSEVLARMKRYTNRWPFIYVDGVADVPDDVKILKFYVFTPSVERKMLGMDFGRTVKGAMVTTSLPNNIEISDWEGHKGNGARALAAHFEIEMENVVVMGDNYNDTGMFEVAGLAVAMGNGEEAMKEMADVVTLSNDESGVAHAIYKYVLK